ncbi:MAG: sigma-70 family RNA polymerase sigma factor [Deltaproteobacteria bacterium]|nr:sigma-70 family RNA polymerase sigma factor [Deltaproteobacteria bacterium]
MNATGGDGHEPRRGDFLEDSRSRLAGGMGLALLLEYGKSAVAHLRRDGMEARTSPQPSRALACSGAVPGEGSGESPLGLSMVMAYGELRRLAQRFLGRERGDHTLQATALVHEAYLRIARRRQGQWRSREHFFNVAAREMRRVLIDHARGHDAARRGGGLERVELKEGFESNALDLDVDLIALDEVLAQLAALDPRKGRVVELRFFGGLTLDETAQVLGTSQVTVVREWRMAKAWLFRQLRRQATSPGE